ncbi:fibronectin type III domain-containing protein [Arthrobacter zhaoxinii]|uniref:fibronectin type III domain-containing protein n=1 Tax=Arthrobacter zhaoxinii TaxID=2964616 RepID=UPI0021036619|nr:fibronectin type III domain-containing protein [Arthrobacter zhaoxinii]MCQ2001130.1 fibronectin type III domain-containing protein [Arthrobacter zhaoxinii]
MAGFDAKKYRDTVLKPTSKGEGYEQLREVLAELRQDPDSTSYARLDLNVLYDIPSPVKAEELKGWKAQIVPALNKAGQLPSAPLLKALLELLEKQGHVLTDPSFWGRLQEQRQKRVRTDLEEGLRKLRAEYPLGFVESGELLSRLQTVGVAGVTDKSIFHIAGEQGLQVFTKLQLDATGVPEKLKSVWRAAARNPEYRSVLDLLLLHRSGDIKDVRFLDELTAGGKPFTVADIDAARRQSERGQDTDALQDAQKFLGAAKDIAVSQTDLQQLVLGTVMDWVGAQLGRGKPKLEVRDDLVRRGFHVDDTSRLVSTLSSGTGAARTGLGTVRDKLSEGLLAEASAALTSIVPAEDEENEYGILTARIAELTDKKKALLQRYHQAMEAGDFPAALTAVTDAMRIDQADDRLASLQDAVPPAAPSSLTLRVESAGVMLRWPQADSLVYTVVRDEGRAPATPQDGKILAAGIRAGSYRDAAAPAGRSVSYAVFASRDGTVFSGPRTDTIAVLPAPSDLAASSAPTSALITWSRPSHAAGVVVTRLGPDGNSIETEVSTGSTFRATGLKTGASYRFSVKAYYLLPDGRKFSEAVSIVVVPRGEASAVTDLLLTSPDSDGVVRATWSGPDGFDVELWRFPPLSEVPEHRMSLQQAKASGGQAIQPLPGGGKSGTQTRVLFRAFPGINTVVPLTVDDEGFLVGNRVLSGSAPQPTAVVAEAFGDDLRVSWEWPQGDYIMEVAWKLDGVPRTRRVTRARYRADGGVKIVNGAAADGLTIATVITVDDERLTSTPLPVPLQARSRLTIHYEVRIKRSFTGNVTCVVSAESSAAGSTVDTDLILKEGKIMPTSSTDGKLIEHLALDFTTGTSSRHEIPLGKVKSPFWLSLFTQGNGETNLIAPPTSQLKG